MRLTVLAAIPALLLGAGVAHAEPAGIPAGFPDVSAYPAVDPKPYVVYGAHPSLSGWEFRTPAGLHCRSSLIPDLGVFCEGPVSVGVSLTRSAALREPDPGPIKGDRLLLPVGSRMDAGNGVVCAVPDAATLACLASKPASWSVDTPDPPDRHYGEHGFAVGPAGTQLF